MIAKLKPLISFALILLSGLSIAQVQNSITKIRKWQLTDTTFKTLATIEADSFIVEGNAIIRYLHNQKQIIYPEVGTGFYSDIKYLNSSNYKVCQNKKWGIYNLNKKRIVLPVEFDSIQYLPPFYLASKLSKFGLVDSNFKAILPYDYLKLELNTASKRVLFSLNNSAGFFTINDTCVNQLSDIDSLTQINDCLFLGWKDNKCKMLNEELNVFNSKDFKNASQVSDTSLIAYDSDSLYTYNLKSHKWSSRIEKVWMLLNDTSGLIRDTSMGVHYFRSDTIVHFEGDSAWLHPSLKNKLIVKKAQYFGLASFEGRLLANFNRSFTSIGEPKYGFMEVISKRKYGFIDTNGYMYFATMYDSVKPARNSYCAIKLRGKWGYASRKESIVVQPNYTKTTQFLGETGAAWIGNQAMLINSKGAEVFKPRFDNLIAGKSYWISEKRGLYGFLQTDGKELLNPRFSKVIESPVGFYIVTQYEKTGILNKKLETVFPFESREIQVIKNSPYFAVEVK